MGEQLTPEAVERLEAVAKAARPKTTNAWWVLGGGDFDLQVRDQTGSLVVSVEIGGDEGGENASAVAAHIAAFDPPTCLALLSRISADAERIRALEGACRRAEQFIVNGVELGFIRMPDASIPDPAHETLPAIRAALTPAQETRDVL